MSKTIKNPRNLILDNAKKVLYKEGYSKLSIRRVAKECDIAIGTIYNYFPSKQELIVEMMVDFWDEFFYNLKNILNPNDDFYKNLSIIFHSLKKFIGKFKEIWLNDELYSSPNYIESGLNQEHVYINKLIKIIQTLIENKLLTSNHKPSNKIDPYKTASFILMNFVAIIQMPYVDYEFLENIIKEIFK